MGSNYSLMGNVVFMLYSHRCSCRVANVVLFFSMACGRTERGSVGGLILLTEASFKFILLNLCLFWYVLCWMLVCLVLLFTLSVMVSKLDR